MAGQMLSELGSGCRPSEWQCNGLQTVGEGGAAVASRVQIRKGTLLFGKLQQ